MKKKPTPTAVKLNLGCGYDHRAGYINVDVDPATKPDLIHDLYQPLPYADNTVQEILLQDVLEHFTLQDGFKLLLECQRVLQKKGTLQVRVPNVLAIGQKYHAQPDLLYLFTYGDTTANGVWGAHKAGYDPETMARLLESTEFSINHWQTDDTNFVFTLIKSGHRKIIYTVNGHQPAPVLPKEQFELEAPRHSGKATHLVCTSWLEFLLTPWWRWQDKRVIWLVSSKQFTAGWQRVLAKLLLRPLAVQIDRIFMADDQAKAAVTELVRFSHLRTFRHH